MAKRQEKPCGKAPRNREDIAEEVLGMMLDIARGILPGGDGEGAPGVRERLKAIELIGRRLSEEKSPGAGPGTLWVIRDDL